MAVGKNLEAIIYDLRCEISQSTNPAVSRSTRNRYVNLLNKHQRQFHREYDWPFLEVHRDIQLQAGSRYYDFPSIIDIDRAIGIETKFGSSWIPVKAGIGRNELNQTDSDAGERLDPVLKWSYYTADPADNTTPIAPQIEVWPVPASDGIPATLDGYLRVHGIRKCADMVNDADVCVMDSDVIVLLAAAEILARLGSQDAQAKLDQANATKNKLRDRGTPTQTFTVGGDTFQNESERRKIDLRVAYTNREGLTY